MKTSIILPYFYVMIAFDWFFGKHFFSILFQWNASYRFRRTSWKFRTALHSTMSTSYLWYTQQARSTIQSHWGYNGSVGFSSGKTTFSLFPVYYWKSEYVIYDTQNEQKQVNELLQLRKKIFSIILNNKFFLVWFLLDI